MQYIQKANITTFYSGIFSNIRNFGNLTRQIKISSFVCLSLSFVNTLFAQETATMALGEVTVVSATGFEQNIKDAPATISVITQKEIQNKNNKDLSEIIKDIPGIFSPPINSSIKGKGDIRIRGMHSKYTKILIDGRPVSSESGFPGFGSQGSIQSFIPPSNAIERVEVIRGPMSSLYGTDAMGGVINIITKGFSNEFKANLDGYYTFAKHDIGNEYSTGFYLSGALVPDIFGIALYGRYFHKFEDIPNYANPKNSDRNYGVKFIYNITQNDDLTFDYKHTNNKTLRTLSKTAYLGKDSNENEQNDQISLSYSGEYDKFLINSYLLHDITKTASSHAETDIKLKQTTFNLQSSYFFDSNTLTLGTQYRNEALVTKQREKSYVEDANLKRSDVSIFAENEYYATEDLALTAGIRYNHDKDYGGHIVPRGYAVYHLTQNLSLKGGVSAGYTTPNIDDRAEGLTIPVNRGRGARIGRSSLKPETSVNYEVGFSYDDNEFLSFSAMVFHTDFKDKIDSITRCGGFGSSSDFFNPATWTCEFKGKKYFSILENVNVGKAEINGLELSADWNALSNLAVHTNYTYAKSKQKSGPKEGKALNDIPEHMFKTNLSYDFNKNLNLWSQINYIGKIKNGVYLKTKSYALTDIGLNYKVTKNASINFAIYNVFDKTLVDSVPVKAIVTDGRKFQLGFNVNF